MKRILGIAMTLALICGITANGFAAGAAPKTKGKAAALKNAVLLKNKTVKPHKHRKHRRHRHSAKKVMLRRTTTKTINPK